MAELLASDLAALQLRDTHEGEGPSNTADDLTASAGQSTLTVAETSRATGSLTSAIRRKVRDLGGGRRECALTLVRWPFTILEVAHVMARATSDLDVRPLVCRIPI